MKVMIFNKKAVLSTAHYAQNYAPYYYIVTDRYGDILFDTTQAFRFYTVDDAVGFCEQQMSLLNPNYRECMANFTLRVYREGFRKSVYKIKMCYATHK